MEYNEKQLQILRVAEHLFASKGFTGTSVRDISKEADVNVAMISYYFGSKEKLLQAIFQKRTDQIKMQIESTLDSDIPPLEKVYKLIDTYIDKISEQPNFHRLMMGMTVTEQDEIVKLSIYEGKKRNHELIKKLIQEGQKSGAFKKNIDIPLMMATMIGTTNHVASSLQFFKGINNAEGIDDEEYKKTMRKKLSIHLKKLFKAILTYEEK